MDASADETRDLSNVRVHQASSQASQNTYAHDLARVSANPNAMTRIKYDFPHPCFIDLITNLLSKPSSDQHGR